MGLFSKEIETLDDLLLDQLQDLYDAEKRLTAALPKMVEAAHCEELKQALSGHLHETGTHTTRLETIFTQLGHEPSRETCDAMKGLIREGQKMIEAEADPSIKDAGLIAAAQRVEHYEIAGYGTARQFARQLGHESVADLLGQTLKEEKQADETLTEIAQASVNVQAAHTVPR